MSAQNVRDWTYKDILQLPQTERTQWRTVAFNELKVLRKCKVFEFVDWSKGKRIIKNWLVFDIKMDRRKKARLVTCRFSQIERINFNQIFSPVVWFETVRLIFTLSVLKNWHLSSLDMQNAYLYSDLEEELYIEQLEGFSVKEKEHQMLCLRKILYSLK